MKHLRLATALLALVGVPLACASVGDSDGPAGERDAGAYPADGSGDGQAREEAAVDGGPCSASKVCRTTAPVERTDRLTSVWGSSATDVWAVGSGGKILHYDGITWEAADRVAAVDGAAADFTLRNVWLGARDDVWIADGHRIRHATGWKGPSATEWSFYTYRPSECGPVAASGVGGTVWVASLSCNWMMRFEGGLDGGGPYMLPYLDEFRLRNPTAIAMTRADEVWVAASQPTWTYGNQGHIFRLHLEGTIGDPPEPNWQLDEFDGRTNLGAMGLWGNEQVLWAVGEGGLVRRVTRAAVANKSFDVVESPVTETLYGVFGFGGEDVWAVGEGSTVVHWDGKSWTKLTTPFDHASPKPRLSAVWGSSPADVWIVGDGAVLHYQENAP